MNEKQLPEVERIMWERFGCDRLISIATVEMVNPMFAESTAITKMAPFTS